ncbi:MAG TPA: beta-ketoacyl synthase N-terminal-like domain-containing protein, partial [Ktedonobacteraceae bacterium]|nr:beta-ketoacyl synthase N-terminal-like domain-containing protein [Ktedonobacteraceae bacterium]
MLLEVAWEAFEDAGLLFSEVAGSNTSVSIGVGWGDYLRLLTRNWSRIDRYALTGNASSVVANRLSYTFDLRGPSVSLDVGCSSSLMAVYLACQSLWTGESDLALAGGVHLLLSPDGSLIISKAGFLSSDGVCRALDAQANGTVLGEGAGVVLLKRLSQVQPSDRVYAVICGVEANHNGQTDKIIAPSQAAQVELLRKTYRNAKIDPAELDYIELHGMGFLRGDAVEANALGEVLSGEGRRTHACLVGSVKTNIGDLESAAGIASLIKVALALYHREIPPSLHFTQRNPDISLRDWQLAVPLTCEPWPEKEKLPLAGVTTLALAGANVHAVVSAPSSRISLESQAGEGWNETEFLLPLSAHTPEALRAYISSWKDFLAEESISPAHWQRICSTASLHRMHRRHRCALVSRTPEQAIHLLDAFLRETELQSASQEEQPSHLSFLFPHEGILPEEIDGELLRRERVLQATLRACNRFLREQKGITFLEETSQAPLAFSSEPSTKRLAAFALQLALVDLWHAWGIVPTGVTGGGWGEVAAAYAAGALSLEAALSLVTPAVEEGGALGGGTLRCAMYSLHAGFLPAGSSLAEDHWEIWRRREPETRDLWQKSEWIDQLNAEIVLILGATSASTEALAAREGQQNAQVTLLPTLQGARSPRESMLQALGTLYVLGYTINWSALYEPSSPVNQCVSLPPFPWQRERCWPNWLTVEEISTPPEMRDGLSAVSQAPALTFAEQLSTRSLEEALVALWAEILGVEQLDAQAHFFELGGHSLLATRLITRIRTACQVDLPLNALLSAPTPAACAELILRQKEAGEHAEQLSPAFPEVPSNLEQRYLPFPTTEVQQAYWLGRDVPFESIRVGNHGYIEVAARDLDVPRFNQAIQRLVDRHEMLRAVMLPDGQQQILPGVPPFEATIIDLRGESAQEAATRLQEIRQEMDHQILPVDRWPSFDIRILLLDERNAQIHLSVEVLFVDAWSTHLLIQEFLQFYRSPEIQLPALELSFRDYVLAEAALLTTEFYRRSEEYWKQRLADLPPAPELPLAQSVDPALPRRFVHRERRPDKERWSRLKARAAQVGLTPSGLLLAAFAEAIGAWCKNPRFTINLSVFHRLPLHA